LDGEVAMQLYMLRTRGLIIIILFLFAPTAISTTTVVYGQIFFPKGQTTTPTNNNSTFSPASPSLAHAKPQSQPSTPSSSNAPSTLSLIPQVKPHLVKISSPTKGEQVTVGKDLVIAGTSAGNTNATSINCQVSITVNGIKPYRQATASGPDGAGDYSKWNFTVTSKYTAIKAGQNKIAAKYSCANSPRSYYNSVNVTGVTTTVTNSNITATAGETEINLKLKYAHFISMPTSANNKERQVKLIVNYTAASSTSILNKTINAVTKVYAANGTLIKTSSFPKGFVVKRFGTEQLATSIKDNKIQQLTAVVQFVTRDKLQPLSNPITVKLVFGQKISNRV
jgi:hypothetical protein